jgi:cytochrome c553
MPRPLFLLLALLPALVQAAEPARPAKLGQCVGCHGANGRGLAPGTPHLAGQDEAYLNAALRAYRSGSRQAAPMNSIANTLQPRDIAALARWYSQQAGTRTP